MSKHNPKTIQLPLIDPITIELTKGYKALIDPIDSDVAQLKWYALISHNRVYAVRKKLDKSGKQCTIFLHRVILERELHRPLTPNDFADHCNNDSLDNRRANLRTATDIENMRNSKRRIDSSSGFKGVSYSKQHRKWNARIKIEGKRISLGLFLTPEEAYAAYCKAAKQYFGEFARLE